MLALRHSRLSAAALFILGVSLTLVSCGDDGGVDSILTVEGITASAQTGVGIPISFRVSGLTGQSGSLLFEYILPGQTPQPMNITVTLAPGMAPPPPPPGSGIVNFVFPAGSSFVDGAVIWNASANLTVFESGITIRVTPTNTSNVTTDQVIPGILTGVSFTPNPIPMATAVSGAGIGAGASGSQAGGRASHTSHVINPLGSNEFVIVAGRDNTNTAVSDITRLTLTSSTTYSANSVVGSSPRIRHASAFYFGSGNAVRVLVTGGRNASNTDLASADVYQFGTTASQDTVTPTGTMAQTRSGHSAVWLPNNTVLIAGGAGSGPSTAEIYNPATGLFTAAASMPTGRSGHTCCLLPTGDVLLAGGSDPAAPTTPLPALLYNFKTNSWSSTGTTIDRKEHTATLLPNGACYLIGGRRVSNNTVLGTAHAYRSVPQSAPGGSFPAGFSTLEDVISTARAEHASSLLGSGAILVTGGFGATDSTLASAEMFLPNVFTQSTSLGSFSAITGFVTDRARHSLTVLTNGTALAVGGVQGSLVTSTVLNSVESYAFSNTAPTVSFGATPVLTTSATSVNVTFTLADANNDRSFVFMQYSTNGGASFQFATLSNFATAVDLAPGTRTLNWNPQADGVNLGTSVIIRIIPVGGVFGTPVQTSAVTL